MKMYHSTILVAKKRAFYFILLVLTGFIQACKPKEIPFEQLTGTAQGTTFSIVYRGIEGKDFSNSVDSIFAVIDQSMSLWIDSSEICLLNKSKTGEQVDTHFQHVFNRSVYFNTLSQGGFDPTVGPLLKLWSFARKNKQELPQPQQLDSLRRFIGLDNFALKGELLEKKIPEASLDFNAIAQGYTVDVIADFLTKEGIPDFLIEVGGEIRAKGHNQFGQKWKVGIERPDFNTSDRNNAIQDIVGLSDAALATSGSYRKFVEVDGKKYSHTIDPKTGMPVNHNMLCVSVIDSSAMDADAYATMFMVMGQKAALEFANEHELFIQCISEENGQIKVSYSKGFEKLIIDGN